MERNGIGDRDYPAPPEAAITEDDRGKQPAGEGWFVLNATEAVWHHMPGAGRATTFEPAEPRFETYGANIHVLEPGEPNGRYHAESNQEDFLVLSGECILVIEGEERRLRAWDFVHCPAWTRHIFVGAGDGPCAILMMGARDPDERIDYPLDEAARRNGAETPTPTSDPKVAYADQPPPQQGPYTGGLSGA